MKTAFFCCCCFSTSYCRALLSCRSLTCSCELEELLDCRENESFSPVLCCEGLTVCLAASLKPKANEMGKKKYTPSLVLATPSLYFFLFVLNGLFSLVCSVGMDYLR